ncbi:hypothetical protein VFPPC_17922 [Pochonia chlamydosporia 170]|uniref:Uncharacterized protein n=1 Tax=Pochonia chlamydosporia 170 TaxID=1380566 RepID=A0A219ARQ0_METCM|nr:hypothetical protein VFPPC_17922 [Pochonia chlamydosporia 170]OWT42885.1 hypothetical protein VFPPC_17922 [Pochonia chlamydosporia 170]
MSCLAMIGYLKILASTSRFVRLKLMSGSMLDLPMYHFGSFGCNVVTWFCTRVCISKLSHSVRDFLLAQYG